MRLWLTHRAKTLNHQRNKHSCRLDFAKEKTCPCKLTLDEKGAELLFKVLFVIGCRKITVKEMVRTSWANEDKEW